MKIMNEAVKAANKLIRTHEERNPEKLARRLGIWIKSTPFKEQKGVYTIINRQPIIFVKDDITSAMRSMVIAHELGHHMLHRGELKKRAKFQEHNIFYADNNHMEYEANLFAAQLMLPDDEILEYLYQGYSVSQIARAMRSNVNLVALKISELNSRGYKFREQEVRNNFY